MNTKIKIAIAVVIVTGSLAYYVSILGSEIALFERFPDIDSKIVVKAHRKMIRNMLMGKYNAMDTSTDEALDAVFLQEVAKLTTQ